MVESFEEIQGKLRGLLITLGNQLPKRTVDIVNELIEHAECGVALEILSDMLVESSARLTETEFDLVTRLAGTMKVSESYSVQLKALVHT